MEPEQAEAPLIYLGTPCKGELPLHYILALQQLQQGNDGKYRYDWSATATGSIAICRDILAHDMLAHPMGAAGILMIDSDMKWCADHVRQIVGHGLPLVGASYARKEIPARWVMSGLTGEEKPDPATGLLQVHEIGTGFLWIAREVLEAIRDQCKDELEYFVRTADGKVNHTRTNFFFQGVKEKQFHGEDYGFCYFARKCGFKIYADTRCVIPHSGSIDYPVQLPA